MTSRLVNFALYQTGWFCCVFGAAQDRPWLGAAAATALLLVHVMCVTEPRREIRLVLMAGLIGAVVDSLQSCVGLLEFHSGYVIGCLAPPWIVVIWMQFATLFRFGLAFLSGRYLLGAALGALGGPLAFLVGERIGAVEFGAPAWRSLLALGVVWALVLPALLRLAGPRESSGLPAGYMSCKITRR